MIGMVRWFNNSKGFGFIMSNEGEDLYVHYTSILREGFRTLNTGDKVKFDKKSNREKAWAVNVRIVAESLSKVT